MWFNTSAGQAQLEGTPNLLLTCNIQDFPLGNGVISNLNPLFVNMTLDNYQLSDSSPCKDLGTISHSLGGQVIFNIPASAYNGTAPDLGYKEK
ncbi:MAG: hypothetical protein NW226_08140 [Microscillaceae bacterium]|nr:hypothetical protein [Microscillaceae bacterium]